MSDSRFEVNVDLTNPGQVLACCGMFEVAERVTKTATAAFDHGRFEVTTEGHLSLARLLEVAERSHIEVLDEGDRYSSPVRISFEGNALHLDWWKDRASGGASLKPWAGTMAGPRIAQAMQHAIGAAGPRGPDLFEHGQVVHHPVDGTKVEPFYFDARRSANAQSLDVGFSLDALGIESLAYPAVEFFALIGLQRFRPRPTDMARVCEYYPWKRPLRPLTAMAWFCGEGRREFGFVFENAFRTDQRKHKAFSTASPLGRTAT